MFGESGTSRTGEVHRYYKCATAKKKKGCKKKTVRKQWLEDLVVNQTMQLVRDDAAMESIIAKVMVRRYDPGNGLRLPGRRAAGRDHEGLCV